MSKNAKVTYFQCLYPTWNTDTYFLYSIPCQLHAGAFEERGNEWKLSLPGMMISGKPILRATAVERSTRWGKSFRIWWMSPGSSFRVTHRPVGAFKGKRKRMWELPTVCHIKQLRGKTQTAARRVAIREAAEMFVFLQLRWKCRKKINHTQNLSLHNRRWRPFRIYHSICPRTRCFIFTHDFCCCPLSAEIILNWSQRPRLG